MVGLKLNPKFLRGGALSLTIVATNELHDFNHVLGCNYEKDLHL